MVKEAYKHKDQFIDITYKYCIKNDGFSHKSNLKITSKSQKNQMMRIK